MFLISECNLFLSSQFEYSVRNLDSQRNILYLVNFIHHLPSFLIQVEGGLKKFFLALLCNCKYCYSIDYNYRHKSSGF